MQVLGNCQCICRGFRAYWSWLPLALLTISIPPPRLGHHRPKAKAGRLNIGFPGYSACCLTKHHTPGHAFSLHVTAPSHRRQARLPPTWRPPRKDSECLFAASDRNFYFIFFNYLVCNPDELSSIYIIVETTQTIEFLKLLDFSQ